MINLYVTNKYKKKNGKNNGLRRSRSDNNRSGWDVDYSPLVFWISQEG